MKAGLRSFARVLNVDGYDQTGLSRMDTYGRIFDETQRRHMGTVLCNSPEDGVSMDDVLRSLNALAEISQNSDDRARCFARCSFEHKEDATLDLLDVIRVEILRKAHKACATLSADTRKELGYFLQCLGLNRALSEDETEYKKMEEWLVQTFESMPKEALRHEGAAADAHVTRTLVLAAMTPSHNRHLYYSQVMSACIDLSKEDRLTQIGILRNIFRNLPAHGLESVEAAAQQIVRICIDLYQPTGKVELQTDLQPAEEITGGLRHRAENVCSYIGGDNGGTYNTIRSTFPRKETENQQSEKVA